MPNGWPKGGFPVSATLFPSHAAIPSALHRFTLCPSQQHAFSSAPSALTSTDLTLQQPTIVIAKGLVGHGTSPVQTPLLQPSVFAASSTEPQPAVLDNIFSSASEYSFDSKTTYISGRTRWVAAVL